MGIGGRADRTERLKELKPGAWGSSSADFAHLVRSLLEQSKTYAARFDGNCSPYSLCAIPMLLSSLRCLAVEYASFLPFDADALDELAVPDDFRRCSRGIAWKNRYDRKLCCCRRFGTR
jgi:hypothetical protein